MRARGGCFETGMGISGATGSLVLSPHLIPQRNPQSPRENRLKREQPSADTYGSTKKKKSKIKHNTPHKDIFKINLKKKIEPNIDHQSSWCLTKKYLELSQLGLKCPGYETIIVLLFRYLLTTVETTDVEWRASENCNEVGTNSF